MRRTERGITEVDENDSDGSSSIDDESDDEDVDSILNINNINNNDHKNYNKSKNGGLSSSFPSGSHNYGSSCNLLPRRRSRAVTTASFGRSNMRIPEDDVVDTSKISVDIFTRGVVGRGLFGSAGDFFGGHNGGWDAHNNANIDESLSTTDDCSFSSSTPRIVAEKTRFRKNFLLAPLRRRPRGRKTALLEGREAPPSAAIDRRRRRSSNSDRAGSTARLAREATTAAVSSFSSRGGRRRGRRTACTRTTTKRDNDGNNSGVPTIPSAVVLLLPPPRFGPKNEKGRQRCH